MITTDIALSDARRPPLNFRPPPDSMPFTNQLADHLLQTAPEHTDWSLVESPNAAGCFDDLMEWATEFPIRKWEVESGMRKLRSRLGLVLLWLESETARRKASDGTLWPILSNRKIVPWNREIYSHLFDSSGNPTQEHRDLLRTAAEVYSLRRTFNVDEGQQWYRLIYLQFGFTHDDASRSLAQWLTSPNLPVSVKKLLEAKDAGAEAFKHLWSSLRMFRLNNLNQATLESRLRANPWVLPEWSESLIRSAKKSDAPALNTEDLEANESSFFTSPQLTWSESQAPRFSTRLCNLEQLDLHLPCYQLKARDTVLAQLIRQPDGTYYNANFEAISLPLQPGVALSLVGDDEQIIAHHEAILWDQNEEITLYSPRSGTRIPPRVRLREGMEIMLISSSDVTLQPSPAESVDLPLGYQLHRIARGWEGQLEALLDGVDVVWTSTIGSAPKSDQPPVTAMFTRTLDLTSVERGKDERSWRLPLNVRIPMGWAFNSLRWRRANGELIQFSALPDALDLTEADAVRPVTLNVRITNGTRFRTEVIRVPVPFVAALKWSQNGTVYHQQQNRKLLLGDAGRHTWSFSLPAIGGQPRDPRLCSLSEGYFLLRRLKTRPSALPDLGGYGAPLNILDDPYIKPTPIMQVSPCVLDDGIIGSVTYMPEEGGIYIKSKMMRAGPQHRLLIWHSVGKDSSTINEIAINFLLAKEDGWLWKHGADLSILAVALEFRGVRLGSWFSHQSWSRSLTQMPPGEPGRTAVMLRAWKAPVLQEEGDHLRNVTIWLKTHWAAVLPVWMDSNARTGPGNRLWEMPSINDHWRATVSDLLIRALPMPDGPSAKALVEAIAPEKSPLEALGIALFKMVEYCPILAARVTRVYLNSMIAPASRPRFFDQVLSVLGMNDPSKWDQRATELAMVHGNRDGHWLEQTVPRLASLDRNPITEISHAYRVLSNSPEYRAYVLGRFLSEIR
ncbi:MAG: hypothetical protein JWL59_4347 [Chthoniobacteraceae bacterium]|nr:hypothetical protein [Chthoniobacteraceae bacterium]